MCESKQTPVCCAGFSLSRMFSAENRTSQLTVHLCVYSSLPLVHFLLQGFIVIPFHTPNPFIMSTSDLLTLWDASPSPYPRIVTSIWYIREQQRQRHVRVKYLEDGTVSVDLDRDKYSATVYFVQAAAEATNTGLVLDQVWMEMNNLSDCLWIQMTNGPNQTCIFFVFCSIPLLFL